MPLQRLEAFSKKVSDLSDKPNETMTTAQVKAQFDAAPEEVRVYLNKLIDVLQSTATGDSGADNIKLTPIDSSPNTVRDALVWLKNQINVAQLGQLTDGSLTDVKLSNDPADIKARFGNHQNESMPHHFIDGGITYKYGWKVEGGALKFIYEEVM